LRKRRWRFRIEGGIERMETKVELKDGWIHDFDGENEINISPSISLIHS
jgi:hypothetical protein